MRDGAVDVRAQGGAGPQQERFLLASDIRTGGRECGRTQGDLDRQRLLSGAPEGVTSSESARASIRPI